MLRRAARIENPHLVPMLDYRIALVQALSTADEVVVTTSSLLLIKSSGRLLCRVLTDREIRAVRAHPELIGQPQRLLWALAEIAGSDGADEGHPVIETQVFTCCPTCGYRPDEARERWQQHQDLSVTWLSADPEAPSALVERRHCRRCRPAEPSRAVVCEMCGAGPVICGVLAHQMANGTPPESVRTWLRAQGWYDRPGGVGMICSGHPGTTMR